MLASFSRWFLNYHQPIVLLLPDISAHETAVQTLVRLGFDNIAGFLVGGFES